MEKNKALTTVVALALATTLAACGGGAPPSTSETSDSSSAEAITTEAPATDAEIEDVTTVAYLGPASFRPTKRTKA